MLRYRWTSEDNGWRGPRGISRQTQRHQIGTVPFCGDGPGFSDIIMWSLLSFPATELDDVAVNSVGPRYMLFPRAKAGALVFGALSLVQHRGHVVL